MEELPFLEMLCKKKTWVPPDSRRKKPMSKHGKMSEVATFLGMVLVTKHLIFTPSIPDHLPASFHYPVPMGYSLDSPCLGEAMAMSDADGDDFWPREIQMTSSDHRQHVLCKARASTRMSTSTCVVKLSDSNAKNVGHYCFHQLSLLFCTPFHSAFRQLSRPSTSGGTCGLHRSAYTMPTIREDDESLDAPYADFSDLLDLPETGFSASGDILGLTTAPTGPEGAEYVSLRS